MRISALLKAAAPMMIGVAVFVSAPFVSDSLALGAQTSDAITHYARIAVDGRTVYAVVEGDQVRELDGDLFHAPQVTDRVHALADVTLLAPVAPSKVIAVGRNFESHLQGRPRPPEPGLFAKFPTSIVGPGDDIIRPEGANNLHYEGELVLVIGRRAQNVSEADALAHVFGVTAGNDLSERDWQDNDLQWFRAKGSDTFAPLGPYIVTGVDPDDLLIETRVNGEVRQSERSSDLIYDISHIVSYVSRYVTLEPGDVIYTGTPQTTQPLDDGDVIEVEVEHVGVLRNTLRSRH
jgi:2-keto-4-pentenoate hydratase/2-oxohepta-3-ene-1,7-dioic acid hydratase in catechol pathway